MDVSVHEDVHEERRSKEKERKLGTRRGKEDLKVFLLSLSWKEKTKEGKEWKKKKRKEEKKSVTAVFWGLTARLEAFQLEKLHSSSGEHTIMAIETEEERESSMALELIKFVKQQLEEFEDSNDDETVTSTHEEEERV
ncbi:hypothetical protein Tco_1492193 [Tanacetum coccineum]